MVSVIILEKSWLFICLLNNKQITRKQYNNTGLTKSQIKYNERVKIPDLGICRTDPRCRVTKNWYERYNDDEFPIHHNKRYPILL